MDFSTKLAPFLTNGFPEDFLLDGDHLVLIHLPVKGLIREGALMACLLLFSGISCMLTFETFWKFPRWSFQKLSRLRTIQCFATIQCFTWIVERLILKSCFFSICFLQCKHVKYNGMFENQMSRFFSWAITWCRLSPRKGMCAADSAVQIVALSS